MKILKILTTKRIIGNIGEKAALRFLKRRRYKILARNYVGDGHEIDIIAKKDDVIAFVEVKTRTSGHMNPKEPRPASSVTRDKQQSIISCAKVFLSTYREKCKKRFDIIEVYLYDSGKKKTVQEIKHLENTFNLNTAHSYSKGY